MPRSKSRAAEPAVPMAGDVVRAGEMHVAEAPAVLETSGLGSGLGVALCDTGRGIGGLLHAVLPDRSLDEARAGEQPALFVDAGIEHLAARLRELGAVDLRAVLAGAADARGCAGGAASLGCRNLARARQVLGELGIPIAEERTGGYRIVSLRLRVRDAAITLLDARRREVRP